MAGKDGTGAKKQAGSRKRAIARATQAMEQLMSVTNAIKNSKEDGIPPPLAGRLRTIAATIGGLPERYPAPKAKFERPAKAVEGAQKQKRREAAVRVLTEAREILMSVVNWLKANPGEGVPTAQGNQLKNVSSLVTRAISRYPAAMAKRDTQDDVLRAAFDRALAVKGSDFDPEFMEHVQGELTTAAKEGEEEALARIRRVKAEIWAKRFELTSKAAEDAGLEVELAEVRAALAIEETSEGGDDPSAGAAEVEKSEAVWPNDLATESFMKAGDADPYRPTWGVDGEPPPPAE